MSDNTELAVTTKVKGGGFSAALLAKVKGKDEMSASLQRAKSEGQMRFKVKGNKFYINQGKTETLLKDGKKPAREVLVVIHEAAVGEYAGSMQRQLSEPYNEKNPQWVPMGCWSNNGKAPDDDVWNKQSDLCEECPVRQECSLLRNIALSLYTPEQEVKDLMIFTTNYSSNSQKKNGEDAEELLFSLTGYLKFLSAQGIALHRVVTKLIIDLDSENEPPNNCKVLFQPAGVLDDDDPNMVAHVKWSEEQNLEDVVKVKQMKPVSDEKVGNDFGAEVEEAEEEITKPPAKKKVASKKKAAAKKKPAPVEEELDLDDLDELDSLAGDEDEDFDAELEVDEDLEEEDPDDFGDIDDIDDLL